MREGQLNRKIGPTADEPVQRFALTDINGVTIGGINLGEGLYEVNCVGLVSGELGTYRMRINGNMQELYEPRRKADKCGSNSFIIGDSPLSCDPLSSV